MKRGRKEALGFKQFTSIAIIAEGVPENKTRELIKLAHGAPADMDAFLDQFFNQAVMAKYLPDVIGGLWITLALAGLVIVTGIVLGLALACLRSFQIGWINWLIIIFIDLFRALPPLVLLIVGYFGLSGLAEL